MLLRRRNSSEGFVKNLIVNLNDKIDETPLMNGKSPKEYRNMGKEEIKHRTKNTEKDEQSER